jgi:hypothetical protein
MNKEEMENFKPIFMIGHVDDKFICGICPTDGNTDPEKDGITISHVIGGCLAIIDGFLSLLPEENQNEAEDAIFETIQEMRESRHEYLEKVKFDDEDE